MSSSFIRHTTPPEKNRQDLSNLRRMLPYIWQYRGRVMLALMSLVFSKLALVGVPLVLKEIVDSLDNPQGRMLVLPVTLLLAYGVLRLFSSMFNELRDALFAKVRYHAMRRLSNQVLQHLYRLSLRFHLERNTGGISRDLERGTQSISSILNYMVFNIIPTAAEFILVAFILLRGYEVKFTLVTFATVFVYIGFTLAVTNWRMHFRHSMNRLDSEANTQAIDGLINYETVRYFNNEAYELDRYDRTLSEWETAAVKSQSSMSLLNFGQGAIIAVGVTLIMFYATQGVVDGHMSLGDLVLVNTLMLQLFMPLNFLGIIYRAVRYALADMDRIFDLLDQEEEIRDRPDAHDLQPGHSEIVFDHVSFGYNPDRQILKDISFTVPEGSKVAVVGPSGAGKSTLVRLMFRFYEVDEGSIRIDGQDIRSVTQDSLRRAIGIVPQDTVLFNDTIYHNIAYARTDADREDVVRAAQLANIHDFIETLPDGYDTVVGERGLKLSGGEKQRVAIARVILKNPRILIFDEATSSLDSHSERLILDAQAEVARQHTTLVIAHRLSTIIDADTILVMESGRIRERGSHQELIRLGGLYAQLWALQQQEETVEADIQTGTE
jgi:ATP-binding cassette, subfamily B, heavy metal transporter